MDQDLLDELVKLFGDADKVDISQDELREAVKVHPDLSSRQLVWRCQRLIPDLLRRGIWLQRDGLPFVQLVSIPKFYDRALPDVMPTDFERALAYVNGYGAEVCYA